MCDGARYRGTNDRMSYRKDPGDAMERLEAWGPDRAIASGLMRVAQSAVVEIEGGGFALVTALCRDHVELVPLSIIEPVRHAVTAILRSCRSTAAGGARIPMNRTSLPTRPPARG